MAASIHYPQHRANGHSVSDSKASSMNGHQPPYSYAFREKWQRHMYANSWSIPLSVPIPGVRTRRLRLILPNVPKLQHIVVTNFRWRRGRIILAVAVLAIFSAVMTMLLRLQDRFVPEERSWQGVRTETQPSSLVYQKEDLQRIWEWEIAAGHYPSRRKIPEHLGLFRPLLNPALPPLSVASIPSRFIPPSITRTLGIGAKRDYPNIQAKPPNVAYPPRPIPGSVVDFDVIMEHCDYSAGKYVKDCLEVLRLGGGLDNSARVRRGKMDDWRYIYTEEGSLHNVTDMGSLLSPAFTLKSQGDADPNSGFVMNQKAEWEPPVHFNAPPRYIQPHDRPAACEERPHIFHIFWAGPFTDKPYLALLSFLFTQNHGLNLEDSQRYADPSICRPQFWVWINPGPAAAVPNPHAMRDMFDQLKQSPWASPFLHPRFKNVIHFKLWNTTEQLDHVPELRDEWRDLRDNFWTSGGTVHKVPEQDKKEQEAKAAAEAKQEAAQAKEAAEAKPAAAAGKSEEDNIANRVGSTSRDHYDRLSVILSDLARFALCNRFGGIYLDADTLLLRDWEELWSYPGAFAYRWSRIEGYNTAVLKLNKGSALNTFIFRTALKNGFDFHPLTLSKYMKDAALEPLLLRVPDALFDPAWLNTEDYQRNRPAQPFFTNFGEFFRAAEVNTAAPHALGFNGFFKGAYSYHYHNAWWKPFDAPRNWPDLGPRFAAGEKQARLLAQPTRTVEGEDLVSEDKPDLDWSAVVKRTFEAYIRGEIPSMYGEWLRW